jgi:hypothetical protein
VNGLVGGYDQRMRALRHGRLLLVLGLIAFVAIAVPSLAGPRPEPLAGSATASIGHGVIRAVDATMADSADTRAGRADRHTPRNHELPLVLPVALFALVLLLVGTAGLRPSGPAAVARLRDCIGRRAPPALVAS